MLRSYYDTERITCRFYLSGTIYDVASVRSTTISRWWLRSPFIVLLILSLIVIVRAINWQTLSLIAQGLLFATPSSRSGRFRTDWKHSRAVLQPLRGAALEDVIAGRKANVTRRRAKVNSGYLRNAADEEWNAVAMARRRRLDSRNRSLPRGKRARQIEKGTRSITRDSVLIFQRRNLTQRIRPSRERKIVRLRND